MTPDETVALLAYFTVAYPSVELHEATHAVWIDMLADVDPELGVMAARRIVEDDQWFPTVARFREVVAAVTPRPSSTAALPLPRSAPDEVEAGIAAMRAALRKDPS